MNWQPPTAPAERTVNLTGRRVQILHLLCLGWTNEEIATALYLTVESVKTHLKRMYPAMGVHGRVGAVAAVYSGRVRVVVDEGGKGSGNPRTDVRTRPLTCENTSEAAERGNAPRPLDPPFRRNRKEGPW